MIVRPGRGLVLSGAICATLLSFLLPRAAHASQTGEASGDEGRTLVPADTLPVPLERTAPLGVEELAAGFTATDEAVELGRKLFFDPILSASSTIACATCHRPEFAFADDLRYSLGERGQETKRNSPSLLNRGLSQAVMWDGRASSLEHQALMPIEDSTEMALGEAKAIERLAKHPDYAPQFRATFGRDVDSVALAEALASFVRALTAGDSPVDRFRDGDVEALTASEEAGLWIYEGKGRCWRCHNGPNFADESFHNTGVGAIDGTAEDGRFTTTGDEADRGTFRTPGLRMLTKTAPYMHDGSIGTLAEVVEFYRRGGNANGNLSDRLKPITLTDVEAANLVAFLEALSR